MRGTLRFLFLSHLLYGIWLCENLHYESVCFKELHNVQEYYWPTTYRAGGAVVSTITSSSMVGYEINLFCFVLRIQPGHCEIWEIEMAKDCPGTNNLHGDVSVVGRARKEHDENLGKVMPESLWKRKIKLFHEGHQGMVRTTARLRQKVVAQHGQADWTGHPGLPSLPAGWTKMQSRTDQIHNTSLRSIY